MMKKIRRKYTREFKLEALRLLESSGKSASQIEQDLGIGSGNLYRWKRKLAKDGQDAFPGHGRLSPEQDQIRQLERENAILRQQRDILHLPWRQVPWKKAVAIFSHQKE
jgi:transposase